jgi:hypothetical protein
MRQRYVMRDGKLIPKELAAPLGVSANESAHVISDIKPFVTQDGKEITSRSGLRAYEQRMGVKQVGNDWTGSSKPKFWDAWRSGDRRSAIGE